MPASAETNARLLRSVACLKVSDTEDLAGFAGAVLPEAEAPLVKDLGYGLFATYLVDEGAHLRYVQNRDLTDSDFTAEGLHECALNNLARSCEGKAQVQQHGPIRGVFFDGVLEASLMLIDPLWDVHLAHLAPNGFVAALPARDVLAFCDTSSKEGIEALRQMAARVTATGDHLLTQKLYTRRSGRWVPFA